MPVEQVHKGHASAVPSTTAHRQDKRRIDLDIIDAAVDQLVHGFLRHHWQLSQLETNVASEPEQGIISGMGRLITEFALP